MRSGCNVGWKEYILNWNKFRVHRHYNAYAIKRLYFTIRQHLRWRWQNTTNMMTYSFLYEIADDEDSMQQNLPQWQFYFSSHTFRPVFLTLPHDVSLCLVKYFLLKKKNWQIIIDKNFWRDKNDNTDVKKK